MTEILLKKGVKWSKQTNKQSYSRGGVAVPVRKFVPGL
jgi:hypothetical protein